MAEHRYRDLKKVVPRVDGMFKQGKQYVVVIDTRPGSAEARTVMEYGFRVRYSSVGDTRLTQVRKQVERAAKGPQEAALSAIGIDLINSCVDVVVQEDVPHEQLVARLKRVKHTCVGTLPGTPQGA